MTDSQNIHSKFIHIAFINGEIDARMRQSILQGNVRVIFKDLTQALSLTCIQFPAALSYA